MHQPVLCRVLFLGCMFGTIEGCTMKKHLPATFPKAVQWVYRYCSSNCKFQMLSNWLLVRIQFESQLRMDIWKPKASDFITSKRNTSWIKLC